MPPPSSFNNKENIEEAIEKWRSIANIAGEEDRQLQARAWFSIGYLHSHGEGADLAAAIDAYTKAIDLSPAYAMSYNNRGYTMARFGQPEAALADLDRAIELRSVLVPKPTIVTATRWRSSPHNQGERGLSESARLWPSSWQHRYLSNSAAQPQSSRQQRSAGTTGSVKSRPPVKADPLYYV